MSAEESVVLRGKYNLGTATWTGAWGFADRGESNPFEYKRKSKVPAPDAASAGYPPDMYMSGAFALRGCAKSVDDDDVLIRFRRGPHENVLLVSGSGNNRFGAYTLSGTFDFVTHQLELTRTLITTTTAAAGKKKRFRDDDDEAIDAMFVVAPEAPLPPPKRPAIQPPPPPAKLAPRHPGKAPALLHRYEESVAPPYVPGERPVSYQEKRVLGNDIGNLPERAVSRVLEIIKERGCMTAEVDGDDDVEIDFDKLDTATMRALQVYVKGVLQNEKKKNL